MEAAAANGMNLLATGLAIVMVVLAVVAKASKASEHGSTKEVNQTPTLQDPH
jgi:hypothetical protein